MRHHFGDLLDREGGYWTMVPNRERHDYRIGNVPAGSEEITVVTVGKDDEHWERALTLPNLQELTLHAPTAEQMLAMAELRSLKRLRITHARPKNLGFIGSMNGLEELVLEYVSGFSDLSPVGSLKRLRALHTENLRRVSDFGGLAGATNLKYLSIYGTTDWQQPISHFEFLRGLPQLEVFRVWEVICRAPYPALLPVVTLRNLKSLQIHGSYLATEEYALMEVALHGVEGAVWGPWRTVASTQIEIPPDDLRALLPEEVLQSNHPDVRIRWDGKRMVDDPASLWFEFTGRAAGRAKCGSPKAEARCREYAERYAVMKEQAKELIAYERRIKE